MNKKDAVTFGIKFKENGEIFYIDGQIERFAKDISKREAIAKIMHMCREKRWKLMDILYLKKYSFIDNTCSNITEWITDEDESY